MRLCALLHRGLLAVLLTASAAAQTATPVLPDAPVPAAARVKMEKSDAQKAADAKEALRISKLAIVNGRPYDQPSDKDKFYDYLKDSYGLPALGRSAVRALYSEGRVATGTKSSWGTDFPGFMQRYGSALASNAISGNVRFGMEEVFHEDMRYIPCHGCKWKHKVENALLAEVTARHDEDGHRFFTLTPVLSDFSGPIIANTVWVPGGEPINGVVATRVVVPIRVGAHLFQEFVLERRHHDVSEQVQPVNRPAKP